MSESITVIVGLEEHARSHWERELVTILGEYMAYEDIAVHISPRGTGNESFIKGYEKTGKHKPHLRPAKVISAPTDGILIYVGEGSDLLTQLDAHEPTWRRHEPEPTTVQGVDELQDYVYAVLALVAQEKMNAETASPTPG